MALALFHGADTSCLFPGDALEPPGRPAFGRFQSKKFHVQLDVLAQNPLFRIVW
jgi:hypothetical protein